jgi:hypothetical protein
VEVAEHRAGVSGPEGEGRAHLWASR